MLPHVRVRRFERVRGQAVALGELGVGALRLPVCQLQRAEQLILEALRGVLVKLLVGLDQLRERERDVVGGEGDRVEQLLASLGVCVGHTLSLVAAG